MREWLSMIGEDADNAAPPASDVGDVDRLARAICAEDCAHRGEPSCWSLTHSEGADKCPWPNPHCDSPGCQAYAAAVLPLLAAAREESRRAGIAEAARNLEIGRWAIDPRLTAAIRALADKEPKT